MSMQHLLLGFVIGLVLVWVQGRIRFWLELRNLRRIQARWNSELQPLMDRADDLFRRHSDAFERGDVETMKQLYAEFVSANALVRQALLEHLKWLNETFPREHR